MNKIRVTKKQIKNSYKNIIEIGYCGAQYLLGGQDARFYTYGVYGWNADVYEINYNTCIVTGYRPFGNIECNYKLLNEYEKKAEKIMLNYSIDYNKRIKKVNNLLEAFIDELMEA